MSTQAMVEFVEQVARMTTEDGECLKCGQNVYVPDPKCTEHQAWEMSADDAIATVHGLIAQARALVAARKMEKLNGIALDIKLNNGPPMATFFERARETEQRIDSLMDTLLDIVRPTQSKGRV